MAIKSGCTNYAHTVVDIYFPDGNVCCQYCPLLETYARKQCRKTGEYIADDRQRGHWCPLKDIEEDDNL